VVSIRLVAVFGAIALITGCGGATSNPPDAGAGGLLAAPIELADCTDWQQATVDERLGTVEQIRNYTGGPVAGSGGHGATLDDEEAYELFERYCANDFARGFKLYKLYGRAAAFGGPQ
jgi:hypothetical protein